jgi:hypothetical protein
VFDDASGDSRDGGMRPPEPTAALGDGASAAGAPARSRASERIGIGADFDGIILTRW